MDAYDLTRIVMRILVPVGIILLIAYLINKKMKTPKVKCDGCGNRISGKFIRITEEDLIRPLNYCSKECKEKNIDANRIKFAALEVE